MDFGITINFYYAEKVSNHEQMAYAREPNRTGCAANQKPSLCSLGETKHIKGSHEGSLNSLDSIKLVMRWRSGTSEMIDL